MKPYYERDGITIYHGDCREILPGLAAGVVVTDPPYSFGLASTKDEVKAGGWGDLMNTSMFYSWLLSAIRTAVENRSGVAWVFNSWRSFPVLARAACDSMWPIESLLVWDKEFMGPGGCRGLRPSYELAALFLSKNGKIKNRSVPDIMRCKWDPSRRSGGHSAEKPVALLRRLIEESNPNGPVLDPFAGSGSTLVAAEIQGRPAIGIEIEERYCEIAAKRLDATPRSMFTEASA